jgi:pilus assembly protein Flp/PilA
MMDMLRKLWLEDDGQDLAEYGLLLALVAVVVSVAIIAFRAQIVAIFDAATAALTPK